MADEQQQNQQKQKGGNTPKAGLTMTTAVSAVNNPSLGETIRGSVCDAFGYMIGAIFTGVASWGLNVMISKFKPGTKTPALFPEAGPAPSAPTSRELMGQMHQLAKTDPEGAKRILESVGGRFNKPEQGLPEASVPALPVKDIAPVAPKQDIPTPAPAPAPEVEQPKSKQQPKSKK